MAQSSPTESIPTVSTPTLIEEFRYGTSKYNLGEKVHVFECLKSRYHYDLSHLEILLHTGYVVSGECKNICQTSDTFKKFNETDRYLGIGVIHKRNTGY